MDTLQKNRENKLLSMQMQLPVNVLVAFKAPEKTTLLKLVARKAEDRQKQQLNNSISQIVCRFYFRIANTGYCNKTPHYHIVIIALYLCFFATSLAQSSSASTSSSLSLMQIESVNFTLPAKGQTLAGWLWVR